MRIDTHLHLYADPAQGLHDLTAYPIVEYGEKPDVTFAGLAGAGLAASALPLRAQEAKPDPLITEVQDWNRYPTAILRLRFHHRFDVSCAGRLTISIERNIRLSQRVLQRGQ